MKNRAANLLSDLGVNVKLQKRDSRAPVMVDMDDFLILATIKGDEVAELDLFKEALKLSHKGLLTHLRRLEGQGFVDVMRGSDEDYKTKYVKKTESGEKIYQLLLHALKKDSDSSSTLLQFYADKPKSNRS